MPNFNYAQIIERNNVANGTSIATLLAPVMWGPLKGASSLISTGYPAEATANERPQKGKASREACKRSRAINSLLNSLGGQ